MSVAEGIRTRLRDEHGFSLIELMVALAIFSVFVTIFITSVINLAQSTTRAQVTAQASSGVLNVFQNIDRQVRWADEINFPGTGRSGGGKQYVEFHQAAKSSSTRTAKCVQWRYDPAAATLAMRSWEEGATPASTWSVKLRDVLPKSGSDYPFRMLPASLTGSAKQSLAIRLDAGSERLSDVAMTSVYVARNSSLGSASNVDSNGDGVSDVPTCSPSGVRP